MERRLSRLALASLPLCLLLAACGERASAPAASPQPETKPEATSEPMPAPAASAPAAPAELPKPPYRFAFATKSEKTDKKDADPRVVEWGEDGCGAYPVAQVEAIPLRDALLLPDWVVEFDDKDRELQRWGRPMAAELIGLDGARLLFRVDAHGQRGEFATTPAGALEPLHSDAKSLDANARQIECPALPTFAESDYAQCFIVKDAAGAERRLAWEAPCT
ncbi:hypothetical protein J5226_16665 [Lysobacter sp. K5869]|uniref:hypothetical protein n=1 Tax=Lysobacter sp. K5869 TaxID=2820808 RepID=UPI001C05F1D0|nr:hypothetical protein [Lysobacter sp. K5869]QWP75251.1 hypothetical protein J5226_16665 [Lysobacter sp. K5869]